MSENSMDAYLNYWAIICVFRFRNLSYSEAANQLNQGFYCDHGHVISD
jgi:hypothetical protein